MDRFQVQVEGMPADEVAFVKAMRVVGDVSLADAVRVFAHARYHDGTVLVAGIQRAIADHVVEIFRAAGIADGIHPSTVASPMICRPQASVAYRRGVLGAIVAD